MSTATTLTSSATAARPAPPPRRRTQNALVRTLLWSPPMVALQAGIMTFATRLLRRPNPAGRRANRIVVIKLDRIGDFVLATPFLRELRRHRQAAWITLVTSRAAHEVARRCPWVDAVVVAPPADNRRFAAIRHWIEWIRLAWRHLHPLRPTLALLPRWDLDLYDAYPLVRLSGAAERVSYSVDVDPIKFARSPDGDRFLTTALSETGGRHEVERNLRLLEAVGIAVEAGPTAIWPAADPIDVLNRLWPAPRPRLIVALCPFSTETNRDWPLERFLAVARHFSARPDVGFLLIAGPEAAAINDRPEVCALPNLRPVAGRSSLDETAALLHACHLVLTVDTGLMHLAAAARRPIVVIHGLPANAVPAHRNSSARFGPWQASHTLVTPAEFSRSPRRIDLVTVDQVIDAVAARLPAAA